MEKIILSLAVMVIIFVVSQKKVYDMTNKYIGDEVDEIGCPTQKGILVHAVIGGLLLGLVAWLVEKYSK